VEEEPLDQLGLFDLGGLAQAPTLEIPKGPAGHFWTENKARLIERYLFYFGQITRHGTYIDGFAGPQDLEDLDAWSARLVIESQPGPESFRLQRFHLFDTNAKKVPFLERLRDSRPDLQISVCPRDFNEEVCRLLKPEVIRPTEATFCLIDQHTFECRWSTLQTLAAYKTPKIELFYFFAEGWLNRALANTTVGTEGLTAWWGNDGWRTLSSVRGALRAQHLARRFRDELGYAYSHPFPVYMSRQSRQVVYYMVHASDHPKAIQQMVRAYREQVSAREPVEQPSLPMELAGPPGL